ncbi:hypothetical protein Pcinc_037149 [Petrolisthes cinctipes]|uniref:Uncharacterized protein n=1 Tax=Petrolisthes cinctipes TaxID=88211 RepID=A0AAE1BX39_PETCI|nr:hypothetical protein Pcinc_037149 [Petrolisthes cinctipes]
MLDTPLPPPPRPIPPPPRSHLPPIPPPRPPARPPPPEEFRSRSPSPDGTPQRSTNNKLEEELRAAGVYFRRPGSPPRVPIKPYVSPRPLFIPPRTHSPVHQQQQTNNTSPSQRYQDHVHPDRIPRSISPDRSDALRKPSSPSVTHHAPRRDSEAVAAALEVLEASLAGISDSSSSDNSPARSHASSVVERRHSGGTDLTHSTLLPHCSLINVDGTQEGQQLDPHQAAMESLNLIEEVYVQTRSPPQSSVTMNAYYPGQYSTSFRASSSSSRYSPTPSHDSQDSHTSSTIPRVPIMSSEYPPAPSQYASTPTQAHPSSQYPPPTPSQYSTTPSQYPAMPPAPDSDSGHESGATSPCDTLTTQTPPASPHSAHTHAQTTTPTPTQHDPSVTQVGIHSRTSSLLSCRGSGVLEGEVGVSVVGEPADMGMGVGGGVGGVLEPRPPSHFVVVAIDFGTTFSGYAFSFTRDPDSVHMMKKWEGGDPGVQNQRPHHSTPDT